MVVKQKEDSNKVFVSSVWKNRGKTNLMRMRGVLLICLLALVPLCSSFNGLGGSVFQQSRSADANIVASDLPCPSNFAACVDVAPDCMVTPAAILFSGSC
jgi:hypothetical protein